MRFVIFLSIFLMIVAAALYVAFLAPYHIYTLAIAEGLKTDFIETKVLPLEVRKGGAFKLEMDPEIVGNYMKENEKLWPVFHFTNFKVPFPVHHPLYNLIPVLEKDKNKVDFGIKITNRKDRAVGKIIVRDPIPFNLNIGKYKLFNLPIYKKMILDTPHEKLWKDLFLKDITLPDYDQLGLIKYTKVIKKYSYSELVYNLFLLKMRSELFPKNSYKIGMFKDRDIGVVELQEDSKRYSKELIYIKTKSKLRILELTTEKYSMEGRAYKNRVLQHIKFKESDDDSAVHLYTYFRELSYDKKVDQEGMIYLFSAWSHNFRKKEYLVQMIQWLERGRGNGKQLLPLYNYATKVYGTSFSKKDEEREDAQKRLERKIEEEIEEEIKDEKGNVYKISEGKFESDEKQMEYFLQKAKDDKENTDDNENILVVE